MSRGFLFLEVVEREKMIGKRIIWGLVAVLVPLVAWAAPSQHTVTVTLNYDFTVDNGCSATATSGCVKQFNIYDITGGGTPVKLFSIATPSGANTAVTGITGTSGLLTLKAGVHTFGATAQMADGTESSPNASTATATVTPGSPVSFSVTVQ
jgi:hypothetical protein